jgi:hypothetical protein
MTQTALAKVSTVEREGGRQAGLFPASEKWICRARAEEGHERGPLHTLTLRRFWWPPKRDVYEVDNCLSRLIGLSRGCI